MQFPKITGCCADEVRTTGYKAVYFIVNRITNFAYVGSTNHLFRRFSKHIFLLNAGTHHCKNLQKDWNNYPENIFELVVFKHKHEMKDLHEEERLLIQAYEKFIYNDMAYKESRPIFRYKNKEPGSEWIEHVQITYPPETYAAPRRKEIPIAKPKPTVSEFVISPRQKPKTAKKTKSKSTLARPRRRINFTDNPDIPDAEEIRKWVIETGKKMRNTQI